MKTNGAKYANEQILIPSFLAYDWLLQMMHVCGRVVVLSGQFSLIVSGEAKSVRQTTLRCPAARVKSQGRWS